MDDLVVVVVGCCLPIGDLLVIGVWCTQPTDGTDGEAKVFFASSAIANRSVSFCRFQWEDQNLFKQVKKKLFIQFGKITTISFVRFLNTGGVLRFRCELYCSISILVAAGWLVLPSIPSGKVWSKATTTTKKWLWFYFSLRREKTWK